MAQSSESICKYENVYENEDFLLFLALSLLCRRFLFGCLLHFERVGDAQVAARGGQQRQAVCV